MVLGDHGPAVLPSSLGGSDLQRAEAVLTVDGAFRRGVADRDVAAVDRILSERFAGVEQSGTMADKQTMLGRLPALEIDRLEVRRLTVRFTDNVATVTGEETAVKSTTRQELLFTACYVLSAGEWRLLSNTQFRDPRQYRLAASTPRRVRRPRYEWDRCRRPTSLARIPPAQFGPPGRRRVIVPLQPETVQSFDGALRFCRFGDIVSSLLNHRLAMQGVAGPGGRTGAGW